jgi:hypothetical protein
MIEGKEKKGGLKKKPKSPRPERPKPMKNFLEKNTQEEIVNAAGTIALGIVLDAATRRLIEIDKDLYIKALRKSQEEYEEKSKKKPKDILTDAVTKIINDAAMKKIEKMIEDISRRRK